MRSYWLRRSIWLQAILLVLATSAARAGDDQAKKLAGYFVDYYKNKTYQKQGLLDSLKDIGKLCAAADVQNFKWGPQFKYEDLVRFNDLLNRELEKDGYHAYLVEGATEKMTWLRCLLGKLTGSERGRSFPVMGQSVKVDVYILSGILVGTENFLRFSPSFYSDRGRLYGVTDMWRKGYSEVVYRFFDTWKQQGLSAKDDETLDKLFPTPDEGACMKQLVYKAWRPLYLETAGKDNAAELFARKCAEGMMYAVFWEEAAHAALNQKMFKLSNPDESLPQLASIAYCDAPFAALGEVYAYARRPPDSPYRQAYDRIVPALAGKVRERLASDKKLAAFFGGKAPATDAEAVPLLYRLDKESLQQVSAALLKARMTPDAKK